MPAQRKTSRNAVSFSQFRRLQLTAFRKIRSTFCNLENVPTDAALIAFALEDALAEGRYADAVSLAGSLAEQTYGDERCYRLGAQLTALVKKVPFKDPSLDPDGKAIEKFLQVEADGRSANEELRKLFYHLDGRFSYDAEGRCITSSVLADDAQRVVSILMRARKYMFRLLGNKPPLEKIFAMCRLGGGSSIGVSGDLTHLMRKLTVEKWSVSPAAEPYARAAAMAAPCFWDALGLDASSAQPLYADPIGIYTRKGAFKTAPVEMKRGEFIAAWKKRVEHVAYDQITCVLKNADCSRTVGSQPMLNMFVQLGAGDFLADVLRDKCDIDLRTAQTQVNGPLALLGSSCEGMPVATIDLRSASDCYYIMLARLMLPGEWFSFLNAIRTPAYRLPGEDQEHRYEKFMAMGNGFCFPLQTLTFWCLLQAVYDLNEVPDRLCAVYGDDIVVYQSAALELIEVLSAVGFETNTSKTFVFGPFRESCGQDYFNGINVRPVVLDEVFENYGQVYHFINSLQRKGYTSLAEHLRTMLPRNRLVRPCSGDTQTALEVPLDEFMASRHARWIKDLQAWSWTEYITSSVPDETEYDPLVHMACALNGATACETTGRPMYAHRRKTETRTREMWRVGDYNHLTA